MYNRKPFLILFKELVEIEGYNSISDFVNDWISKGGSFNTLQQWLSLKGIETTYHNVWVNLRQYLTIPFDYESSYDYKWDNIAKTKGYNSFEEMIKDYRGRLTSTEMAEELGITRRGLNYLLTRLNNKGKPYEDRYKGNQSIGEKPKVEGGYTKVSAKKKWEKIAQDKGYNSLTEAITSMNSKGMNIGKMAEELGVSHKSLRERIEKAGITLTPETVPKTRRRRVMGTLIDN